MVNYLTTAPKREGEKTQNRKMKKWPRSGNE